MKVSRTKFVIIFLVSAFIFQYITNSLLGPKVRLFQLDGDWIPGTVSPIAWKSSLASVLYPFKLILLGPLAAFFIVPDPDPAPPVMPTAFALYWTAIALIIYFLLSKIAARKRV